MSKMQTQQMQTQMRPFVSVLTPTYNRGRFIKFMVACYKAQTYPKECMEWIVLDDGTESCEKEFLDATKGLPNIRYIRDEIKQEKQERQEKQEKQEKQTIGAKRNRLNREARGEILISWDDDDYYSPERVAHAVRKLTAHPTIQLAGSSQLYLYFHSKNKIYSVGPYHAKHATNGTLAVKSAYAKSHIYDETVLFAEEKSFLEEYKHPMIQLDPFKVMLVNCHSENTFNKERILEGSNPFVKESSMKLKEFIKAKELRDFFQSCK